MKANVKPRTVSVGKAAKLLGVGRAGAYKAVECGEIPPRIGRRLLALVAALSRLPSGSGVQFGPTEHRLDEAP